MKFNTNYICNDNLKFHTLIKVSPFSSKVYCLLNNKKPTHLKGKNEFKMHVPLFIIQHKQNEWFNVFWKVKPFFTTRIPIFSN